MAIWSSNNLACINVWSTLYIMKQHDEVFKKAGDIEMKNLLFFNPLLTPGELRFEAEGIADFLDTVFVNTYNASYEEGLNRETALEDMVDILIDGDKTLAHLAEAIDEDYEF